MTLHFLDATGVRSTIGLNMIQETIELLTERTNDEKLVKPDNQEV